MSKRKRKTVVILSVLSLILGFGYLTFFFPNEPNPDLVQQMKSAWSRYPTEFSKLPKYGILIDYNLPVTKKRLWVIDLKTNEIKIHSRVSHARKSGWIWPTLFSNKPGSNLSCKGVFKTRNSYKSNYGSGKYQIGMRIKGLNKSLNDNALQRYIVFHSSLGLWSSGCFMTLPATNKAIIDLTKTGSIVYVN